MSEEKHDNPHPEIAGPSIQDAIDAIRLLFRPGQVVELRALGVRGAKVKKKFTLSGYYDDHMRMAEDVIPMSNTPGVYGIFWTIQIINSALLARSPNRYIEGPEATTGDADVLEYRWLPIDIDPVRAAGISATDEEKHAAFEVMRSVTAFFTEHGVSTLEADSGNGAHVLVAVELKANQVALVARVLAALDERFSTDSAKIDRTVFNPSRIFKAYGSIAKKGESTESRPHRAAWLLQVPDMVPECIGLDLLQKIADCALPAPEKKEAAKGKKIDIEESAATIERFLSEGGITHGPRLDYKNSFKWLLTSCPFNPEHVAPSINASIADTGATGFRCSHNSCFAKLWPDFRKYVETTIGHDFVFSATALPHEELLQWLDDFIADRDKKIACPSLREMAQECSELSDEEYAECRRALAKRLNVAVADLDAIVKSCRVHAAKEAAATFDPATLSVDDVKALVESLLDSDPSEGEKKESENVIWGYLRTHARVFCCNGQGYFLMNDGDGVPIDVSPIRRNSTGCSFLLAFTPVRRHVNASANSSRRNVPTKGHRRRRD